MAESQGVAGWCRNLPDGRVEAVFEGDPRAVEAAVTWCRGGPSSALVTSVDVTPETPENERGFRLG
jgi:acylphosphatase